MRLLITILTLSLLCFNVNRGIAAETAEQLTWSWTPTEVAMQVALVGINYIDWNQTHWILNQPDWREKNRWIKDHGDANTFFLAKSLIQLAGAAALPQDYRKWWQGFWLIVDFRTTYDNYSLGAKFAY